LLCHCCASLPPATYLYIRSDDCWQLCGNYGPENNTYHDEHGAPVIDTSKFPDMATWVDAAHKKDLTAGWYHNNCRCSDHCTSPVCFAADVNATIALGFDSVRSSYY
jgi:hypothetical protein